MLQWFFPQHKQGFHSHKGKALRYILCKLAWATFIYHIWMQQNAAVHNDLIHCRDRITWLIKNDVGAGTEACKGVLCCQAIGSFSLNIFWLGQAQNVSMAHSSFISLLHRLGPLAHKSFFSFLFLDTSPQVLTSRIML